MSLGPKSGSEALPSLLASAKRTPRSVANPPRRPARRRARLRIGVRECAMLESVLCAGAATDDPRLRLRSPRAPDLRARATEAVVGRRVAAKPDSSPETGFG